MKLQIDTGEKVIKVEEKVNLGEFIQTLKKIFPRGDWRNYSIDCNNTITWAPYPWYYTTTSGTIPTSESITTTCFNVDIQN